MKCWKYGPDEYKIYGTPTELRPILKNKWAVRANIYSTPRGRRLDIIVPSEKITALQKRYKMEKIGT